MCLLKMLYLSLL
jgi:H+-transporting ATPase